MAKPKGEIPYSCSICGKTGEERGNEMNYLFPVQEKTGTVWYNRCHDCWVKWRKGVLGGK